jgi:hypothetical protein
VPICNGAGPRVVVVLRGYEPGGDDAGRDERAKLQRDAARRCCSGSSRELGHMVPADDRRRAGA